MNKKEVHKKRNIPSKRNQSIDPAPKLLSRLLLFTIVLITFLSYLPVLQNGFVNWDETTYIQNNLMIRSFNIDKIFSTFHLGNYHPLTMLVYTIEYSFFGLNESGYHAVNLAIHLLNVILVFYLVLSLCKKTEIAFVASLLFGIHPMHVESVAWAAELKDLLYTFFFLSAYISYLKFSRNNQNRYYIYALLLFVLSLLSKAMAVSLPIVLIITDYFTGRKINRKTLIEKIPFILLSLIFGIVAIIAQKSTNSLQDIAIYSYPQRIVFACYSFITYLVKSIAPVKLCAFYPYPIKSGSDLPFQFYLYIIAFIALLSLVVYSMRSSKKIFFGIGFFTATIFLVLQLLPVGDAIMADRYNYIPSIGLFYLAGEGFLFLRNKNLRIPGTILLIAVTILFSFQTHARCEVWKNAMTLWNDVINKYQNISFAYNNRGGTLMTAKRYQEALDDYNKAIELRPEYPDALNNRGILYLENKNYESALKDFDNAIKFKPLLYESYNNRGLVLMNMNKSKESLSDFNKAIELNPDYAQAYYNRGLLAMQENKFEIAYNDYTTAIRLMPNYINAYINRGVLLQNNNRYDDAMMDYNKVIDLDPGNSQPYYNKGLLLMTVKKFEDAINCFVKAIELNPENGMVYYNKGMAEYFLGKTDISCSDLQQSARLGYQPGKNAYDEYCR